MKKIRQITGLLFVLIAAASCKKETSVNDPGKNGRLAINDVVHTSYTAESSIYSLGKVDDALRRLDWLYFGNNHMMDSLHYTPYSVKLPSLHTGNNSSVYLVGSHREAGFLPVSSGGLAYAHYPADPHTFVNYLYVLPDKSKWKIVAISIIGGQFYYAVKDVELSAGGSAVIDDLKQATEAELAAIIDKL